MFFVLYFHNNQTPLKIWSFLMITVAIPSNDALLMGALIVLFALVVMFIGQSIKHWIATVVQFGGIAMSFAGVVLVVASFVGGVGATYKTFDNPVIAAENVNADSEKTTPSVKVNEDILQQSIVKTADLKKIVVMKPGAGYYKTLSEGDEIKFTALDNNDTEIEGTVSFTASTMVVKIIDEDGIEQTFTKNVS